MRLLCLHDMMGNISVAISGFHLTNQIVQHWQKPTFIRTAERTLHITHHIMHIHISESRCVNKLQLLPSSINVTSVNVTVATINSPSIL